MTQRRGVTAMVEAEQMRPRSWRRTLAHSAIVLLVAALAGTLHVWIENNLLLIENNLLPSPALNALAKIGLTPLMLKVISIMYFLSFILGGLVGSIFFLLRWQFLIALSYLMLVASVFAATKVVSDLNGSRFTHPELAHAETAEIYKQRRPLRSLPRQGLGEIPGLIALGDECGPPGGCECWIAFGPEARDRGVDKDVHRDWHPPRSEFFPISLPSYFTIVHVQRIDADAYSVLGCYMDMR
jgi:hypothetical protein